MSKPVESVIKEIEKEGTKFVADKFWSNSSSNCVGKAEAVIDATKPINKDKELDAAVNELTGHMNSGFEKFKAETGRYPSYSEMRAMYG